MGFQWLVVGEDLPASRLWPFKLDLFRIPAALQARSLSTREPSPEVRALKQHSAVVFVLWFALARHWIAQDQVGIIGWLVAGSCGLELERNLALPRAAKGAGTSDWSRSPPTASTL